MRFFHVRGAARWRSILRGAIVVVAVTQREKGLWARATSNDEPTTTDGTPPTDDDAFGLESITLTWHALFALHAALGRYPDRVVPDVIVRLRSFQDASYAYGTPIRGLTPRRQINASARHTAMALMIQRLISPEQLGDRTDFLTPTVEWLLASQSAETGGWSYVQRARQKDEALATAYCVSALSCFLRDLEADPAAAPAIASKIEAALKNGVDALLRLETPHLWPGVYATTPVEDSADIVEMLAMAATLGSLERVRPEVPRQLARLVEKLIGFALGRGWPAVWGQQQVSVAATVAVRLALATAAAGKLPPTHADLLKKVDEFIVEQTLKKDVSRVFKSSDWSMLARLAAQMVRSPLSPDEVADILEVIARIKRHAANGTLTRLSLVGVPASAHDAILYSLTRGKPESVRSVGLVSFVDLFPRWFRIWIGPVVVWAATEFREPIVGGIKKLAQFALEKLS